MTNREIVRQIKAFRHTRDAWLETLARTPDSVQAARHILSINSKIEFLKTMWNWSDESVGFPS